MTTKAGAVEESFRGKTAHALEGARLEAFETFVEEARLTLKVPGAPVSPGRVSLRIFFGFLGYAGWEQRVDEKGCPFGYSPPGAPNGCGAANLDAGADASSP